MYTNFRVVVVFLCVYITYIYIYIYIETGSVDTRCKSKDLHQISTAKWNKSYGSHVLLNITIRNSRDTFSPAYDLTILTIRNHLTILLLPLSICRKITHLPWLHTSLLNSLNLTCQMISFCECESRFLLFSSSLCPSHTSWFVCVYLLFSQWLLSTFLLLPFPLVWFFACCFCLHLTTQIRAMMHQIVHSEHIWFLYTIQCLSYHQTIRCNNLVLSWVDE